MLFIKSIISHGKLKVDQVLSRHRKHCREELGWKEACEGGSRGWMIMTKKEVSIFFVLSSLGFREFYRRVGGMKIKRRVVKQHLPGRIWAFQNLINSQQGRMPRSGLHKINLSPVCRGWRESWALLTTLEHRFKECKNHCL